MDFLKSIKITNLKRLFYGEYRIEMILATSLLVLSIILGVVSFLLLGNGLRVLLIPGGTTICLVILGINWYHIQRISIIRKRDYISLIFIIPALYFLCAFCAFGFGATFSQSFVAAGGAGSISGLILTIYGWIIMSS